MENIKEVFRLLAAVFIFLTASAIVFLVIHSVSHVVGGFSLFAIAVIVVLSFFFIIMLCTYQCGDKSIDTLLGRARGVDNHRFAGVAVIQVPCRYGRSVSSCSESPSDMTRRIYSPPWSPDDVDAGLPPYIDDPPPDYFTATGKCLESVHCINEPTPMAPSIGCTNESGGNTCSSQEVSSAETGCGESTDTSAPKNQQEK